MISILKTLFMQKTLLHNISSHSYTKARDEQQHTLVATAQRMEELERQVKSGRVELRMEKQRLLSVQEVCITAYNTALSWHYSLTCIFYV